MASRQACEDEANEFQPAAALRKNFRRFPFAARREISRTKRGQPAGPGAERLRAIGGRQDLRPGEALFDRQQFPPPVEDGGRPGPCSPRQQQGQQAGQVTHHRGLGRRIKKD
jgi:hypothetical protein